MRANPSAARDLDLGITSFHEPNADLVVAVERAGYLEFVSGLAHTVLRDGAGTLRDILLDWLLRQATAPLASTR